MDNTEYTENEKNGEFELRYIPLSEVEKVLTENAEIHGDKRGVAKGMLELFAVYKDSLNSNKL